MRDAACAAVDDLLLDGRLGAAMAIVASFDREERAPQTRGRRLGAGVYALAGAMGPLAGLVDPRLFVARDDTQVEAYFAQLDGGPESDDYLAAGIVLAWSGYPLSAYRWLSAAYDIALAGGRIGFAVGALERLSHHALLYGDVIAARDASAKAMELAGAVRSAYWRARCAAFLARLAADQGEDETARELIQREGSGLPAQTRSLFAPAAAYLTGTSDDRDELAFWTSADILDVALYGDDSTTAILAAASCVMACDPKNVPPLVDAALKRALLLAESAASAPELFSFVARAGDAGDAQYAAKALLAGAVPNRRYVNAHRLLGQAHVEFRFGDRVAAIDHASDAARAFDALGLRRWTKEAMLLLVHREGSPDPPARRRPSALSLTEREQQVAHLIRRGASNREVAHTLRISEHTVERHVSSILSRLGLRSRWQIVDARRVEEQR